MRIDAKTIEGCQVLIGNCREALTTLPDESVDCVVTSPPYFGLRDYGVDGQMGLESTPDEYIAGMVAVFAEVRRVLKSTGTVWLNLGDSYSHGGNGGHQPSDSFTGHNKRDGDRTGIPKKPPPGFKPKNLLGIPWRIAFALQQPHYTGSIKDERDRVWLAAMIDAEGCMFIHKRKKGQSNGQGYYRKNDNYGPGLEISNTSRAIVEKCLKITGVGSICTQGKEQNGRRKQLLYRWNLRTKECVGVIREIYPHLVAKRQQARILCGCPPSGENAEAAHAALIGLHRGIETSIDFPEPKSMFEPGFYLRQDVIWSKSNPMPESVTDRCTKAHEYIFMFSKSPRYFYDQEAIKEPGAWDPGKQKTPDGWDTSKGKGGHGTFHRKGREKGKTDKQRGHGRRHDGFNDRWDAMTKAEQCSGMRNKRSVWTVSTKPYSGAHFATFPPDLIEPCILAGCPEGGTVLDPFGGSGTTAGVALVFNRKAILCELNPEYVNLVKDRINAVKRFYMPNHHEDQNVMEI